MKNKTGCAIIFLVLVIVSCTKKIYKTNGETIYKTGRNLQGEKMLDKTASRIKIIKSCQGCHGKNAVNVEHAVRRVNHLIAIKRRQDGNQRQQRRQQQTSV